MSSQYDGSHFGEHEQDVLGKGYDSSTGVEITLIACPESAIGGDGPVFEKIDSKSVYVLVSEEFVENQISSAGEVAHTAAIQYGMMLGDMMRRGIYFAQEQARNNKDKENNNG